MRDTVVFGSGLRESIHANIVMFGKQIQYLRYDSQRRPPLRYHHLPTPEFIVQHTYVLSSHNKVEMTDDDDRNQLLADLNNEHVFARVPEEGYAQYDGTHKFFGAPDNNNSLAYEEYLKAAREKGTGAYALSEYGNESLCPYVLQPPITIGFNNVVTTSRDDTFVPGDRILAINDKKNNITDLKRETFNEDTKYTIERSAQIARELEEEQRAIDESLSA
jgi:hypothetical protein